MFKSVFVSLYMMAATAIAVFATISIINSGDYMSWGGVIMTTAPFMFVISWVMLFKNIARTSARFPLLIALAVAGVTASAWGYAGGGSPLAPVLALAGLGGFLIYAYWYSSFPGRASRQLQSGQSLPDFELQDIAGDSVASSTLMDKPVVWMFYRGNWCPLCMAQIKELAGEYRQLQDMGVRVALVSPQPHKFTVGLARKFDVTFDFLTDENNRAAQTLGIAHRNGLPMGMQVLGYDSDTVLPTVIITDTGGRILWVHETDNYRIRPEPGQFLDVLRQHRT